ncbi:DCC1-like thiol-disulfide oxidoreductase family protein [Pseudobacteriovorax antillogorgiicola]|uniref:HTTM-like domain-containing protein n=1 Tax=Pseudobacteriovorax antillogorgiicola TaxID=1513793 RepID=A0A1Y6BSX2_9BACT|nr:HTTM domain-containing protein [Pseudobacteriovorax antillogorgiicola]TCS54683.1 uncharacterized protein DUF393 [Pseudobacteriovorax antillogorgiicola]SMF16570.1 Protein of unknown function, DUF393 [Pseudobacteriovorax antillogorgiicola]
MIPILQDFGKARVKLMDFIDRTMTVESHALTKKVFRIALYSWLFYHTAVLLPYMNEIWGPDSAFWRVPFVGGFDWLNRIMRLPLVENYYPIFLYSQLALLILGILGFWPRLIAVVIWYLTINISEHSFPLLDGGNNLTHLFLFYLLFINTSGKQQENPAGNHLHQLKVGLSNFAFFLARVQLVFVYLCAGWLKLNGQLWQSGMSLYYIFQNHDYSRPWYRDLLTSYEYIAVAGTYFAVLFQVSVPFLIWFRKTRPYVILCGLILHLGIAFGMGLFSFGMIMCLSYILFIPNEVLQRLFEGWKTEHKLVIGFDDSCRMCLRFSRILGLIDTKGRLIHDSANTPFNEALRKRSLHDRKTAMIAWDDYKQEYYSGFPAIVRIARKIPALSIFWPILGAMYYLGLGDILYNLFKRKHEICSEYSCELES